MARGAKTSSAARRPSKTNLLVCPECGKKFTTAQRLGAHRNRAHGVAGVSRSKTLRRRLASAPGEASNNAQRRAVDKDALLRVLFPAGIPANVFVIDGLVAWLEEAEQLSRLR